jgi:tetratricopeptide (TPR) repeat protein
MQHLEQGDPEAALKELSLLPSTPATLELLAQTHFALFALSEAQKCLEEAIHMEPDSGYNKYLLLAQILGGKESLSCLSTALLLIPGQDTKVQSSTHAAIAELYMTGIKLFVRLSRFMRRERCRGEVSGLA